MNFCVLDQMLLVLMRKDVHITKAELSSSLSLDYKVQSVVVLTPTIRICAFLKLVYAKSMQS